jgi:hypothetical protein
MPSAPNSGPAPVPYSGADQSPEPPDYGVTAQGYPTMGSDVMSGVSSAMGVQESGYAHDVNAGLVTDYYPGAISPVQVHGDADPGGRDDVSGTVAGAVAAAEARFTEYQSDTFGQGSTIGDLMNVPLNSLDPAVGVQGAEGAYYDPPRNY